MLLYIIMYWYIIFNNLVMIYDVVICAGGLEYQLSTFYAGPHHLQKKDTDTLWLLMIGIYMFLVVHVVRPYQMNYTGE